MAPVDTGLLAGGTAIGTGLATAINVLRDSEAHSKVVILLTDGENNSGDISPIDAANMAKLLGVRVYTIGALTVASTPDKDVPSDTVDAQLMRRIAEPTGGHFYSVSDELAGRGLPGDRIARKVSGRHARVHRLPGGTPGVPDPGSGP